MSQPFVHLRVHSDYSFGRAASQVADYAKRAKALDQPAFALTDEHNLHGAMSLADKASGSGIQAIVGIKLLTVTAKKGFSGSIILLAQNETGYINLCRLHNRAAMPDRKVGAGVLDPQLLTEISKSGLGEGVIALAGCGADSVIGRMIRFSEAGQGAQQALGMMKFLASLFPNRLYVEICRNGHENPTDIEIETQTLGIATALNLPIVGTTEVLYATLDRHDACLVSQAVAKADKTKMLLARDDGSIIEDKPVRFHMRSNDEMAELFADLPEAFEQTAAIARRCGFAPGKRKEFLPPFRTEGGRSEAEEMASQAREGLQHRIAAHSIPESDWDRYHERLEYEIGIIQRMGFPGYFLIVSDFIKWAKTNNIPVGPGRGSGAGSVVAWSLQITDLDPIRFGLLFERFLNPDRISMPDFDVDFCYVRRDEVIAYVTQRYGRECVAGIATFSGLKAKSALKDAARVVQHHEEAGLAQHEINTLSQLVHDKPNDPKNLRQVYDEVDDFRTRINESRRAKAVFLNASKIEGLYRTSSAHAAGIVMADRPLTEFVPVGFDLETGSQVTQFNMKEVEKAGLVKFDFLALKNLTIIKDALEHVKQTQGLDIDISTLPLDDPGVFEMLAQGRANGVFQFESEGMKNVLVEMQVSRFEDLIAAVSLYRPGPMEMIPTYCRRKLGKEQAVYPDPVERTKPFLEETFGIMVYQEQVMKVAQEVAGYSLGQADLLRRAMGKKIPEEMAKEKGRFIEGALSRGTPDKKAAELFDLIEKFAGYGFNKSHAAAYALIAYQTAWLKCHYPAEYFCALLSHEKQAERKTLIKSDMDTVGIEFLQPDVNFSKAHFVPERKPDGLIAIRFGLTAISGISDVNSFIEEREANGPFKDLFTFHERAGRFFNSAQLTTLSHAGAFDGLMSDRNRRRAADTLTFLSKNARKDNGTGDLFGDTAPVALPREIEEGPDYDDGIQREFNAVGFYFRESPLDFCEKALVHMHFKRRKSIIEHMIKNKIPEMRNMGIFGMVESVFTGTSKKGSPYVQFELSEKNDRYRLHAYPGRGIKPIDQTKMLLESAMKLRRPIAVLADFALREDGTSCWIYPREIHAVEEYLTMSGREIVKIKIDPRALNNRIPPELAIRLAELDKLVLARKITLSDVEDDVQRIFTSVATKTMTRIKSLIERQPIDQTGIKHDVHFTVITRIGDLISESYFKNSAPADRLLTPGVLRCISETDGSIVSVKMEKFYG